MDSRTGRITLIVVGAIVVVVGGVFAGQGADLIPGSSMTGDRKWLVIGGILVIVGLVLVVRGLRRRRSDT
ncbi:hypothetical protein EDF46_0542 [Frondihabitans sp. PhB188]|uniref:hypothetical protein n=1 Tax=Frondihabitans sp. PhB188 TaxID=2485200 RepID=UPI000F48353A|nr:hypothetical protein [Frondihabitans sp. PhB188]ROQ41168.1 hypothetical protein EDF46_0542 [Frondihabitans sp. PhB188]